MSHETREKIIASPYQTQPTAGPHAFAGFKPPTSNTTYTPNQFFDVVLRHGSRGCVRIVAYLIRKTLGWCDAQGNPQREQIEVSYTELVRRAGVSREMIRQALDEAVRLHFVECLRAGRASRPGDFGESALFALKWDSVPHYQRDLTEFRGFFEGDGHRTDIPNEFFDRLIPTENLSLIKIVGSVIRYSIGFQAKHGRRRQQATLAYSHMLAVAGLSSRRTLAGAIRAAIAKNYIVRIDAGQFSAHVAERRSATYAVRWTDGFHEAAAPELTGQKRTPGEVWINQSGKDTSKLPDQSEQETKTGQERTPADQSEKESKEITFPNEKQKRAAVELLKEEGFDAATASRLVREHPLGLIQRQLAWIPHRHATKSRAGLLRRAIEADWPEPRTLPRPERPALREGKSPEESRYETLAPAYFAWLSDQERQHRLQQQGDYTRFTAKRERRRSDILAERNPIFRERLLALHDSDRGRLVEFQKFMALPDFQQWDAEINNQSSPQS
jgi:uncharacterized membrane protein